MSDPDRTALAGEYVLGTLSLADRRRVERLRETDAALDREIDLWERRLGTLADTSPSVAPAPDLLARIERAIVTDARTAPGPSPAAMAQAQPAERSRRRSKPRRAGWYAGLAAMLVIGAGLGYGLERFRAAPATGTDSFVAVINRDATAPALIVRVDLATRIVTVRPIAAERPSDRVFELWYVPDGAGPRSLGIISAANTTRARLPANAAPDGGLLAVSLEPPGGSPTGAPTGPVVYSGRLIRETPE